ncbi:MAG: BatA domain-containing protein [Planctomycetales bacterium]|nr:BatA domain-containing protein [Planctomycetales bacterium]
MSFLQPWMLLALPLMALPILIHLINQRRYQTKRWAAMQFLLAANRMNRGFARIRQWLILALRTLVVAALILAVARPLASGLLGLSGGGQVDTTIVLLDRSPSMQQQGVGGTSKLAAGRQQLAAALETLGSTHWVAIDAEDGTAQAYDSLQGLIDSPALQGSSATSDLASMMQAALDYLKTNKPGPTEIWICSDLRAADWHAESGTWSLVREGFERLPQSVRFHLLAYPQPPTDNIAISVSEVRREPPDAAGIGGNNLLLSLRLSRSSEGLTAEDVRQVPVQIEIEGARSELTVALRGSQTEVRNHRVSLAGNQVRGWGRLSLPADQNNADNEYYFVFDDPPPRRVVVVSEDRAVTRPLEIAAAVAADGSSNSSVEVLTPEQLDSLVLDDAALLLWQTALPDAATAPAVMNFVNGGGQVVFFPPSRLTSGNSPLSERFLGVGWQSWVGSEQKVMIENWRGDQDLLSATQSGAGLPVGQLELGGYARLDSEGDLSQLATLSGGQPLLARVPSERGGVYFFTASPDPRASTLAESGIVLFVAVQRAIERGQVALGRTLQRIAGQQQETTGDWRQLAGPDDVLSTEFASQGGIYQAGEQLFAINRSPAEDQQELLPDERLEALFAGLPFARVDDSAGSLQGIVREVWRLFLIAMIVALLLEAALCLPRPRATSDSLPEKFKRPSQSLASSPSPYAASAHDSI